MGTGWYPGLVYDNPNDEFKPVVADVHTDPGSARVLHAAVGETRLLVVAVDNQGDRRVYAGPAFSYYEFADQARITDERWRQRLRSEPPDAPAWVRDFSPPQPPPSSAPLGRGRPLRR
jgi:Protein of unknown function (DUF3160)